MHSSYMCRPSGHSNERLLHEVLGEVAITAQEIGRSDGAGRAPEVGLFPGNRGSAQGLRAAFGDLRRRSRPRPQGRAPPIPPATQHGKKPGHVATDLGAAKSSGWAR